MRSYGVLAPSTAPVRGSDAAARGTGGPVGKRGQLGTNQWSITRRTRSALGGGLLSSPGEVPVSQPVPVVVTCHLCEGLDDGHIVTTGDRAWIVAMDHALDEHRDAMIADPENGTRSFTVNTTGRPQLLRRPERVEATR